MHPVLATAPLQPCCPTCLDTPPPNLLCPPPYPTVANIARSLCCSRCGQCVTSLQAPLFLDPCVATSACNLVKSVCPAICHREPHKQPSSVQIIHTTKPTKNLPACNCYNVTTSLQPGHLYWCLMGPYPLRDWWTFAKCLVNKHQVSTSQYYLMSTHTRYVHHGQSNSR